MRGLAGLLAAAALAASPVAASASSALRPLLLERGTYGESFTFVADLDDGSYLQVGLSFTNLGPGSTKGICRAILVEQDGRVWDAHARFARSEISWRDGGDERLAVGTCAASLDEAGTAVEVRLDGGIVRLRTPERPRRQGGHSDAKVDGRPYQNEVLLYRAPVTATVARAGAPARTVDGAVFLDHSRSAVPPKDLARRWVRFRALRGEQPLLVLGREASDGRFGPSWSCRAGGCREDQGFAAGRHGAGRETTFVVDVKGEAPIRIRSLRLLYRDAPLDQLGILAPLVRPFTGAPVTYVYRAEAEEQDRRIPGILEVELAGE